MAYEYTRGNDLYESTCYLISKETVTDENGVVQDSNRTKREVFCKAGGVYEKEFFDAYQSGIKAQLKLIIFFDDYQNEMLVDFEGEIYSVYRKYRSGDELELYLRKDVGEWD